MKRVMIIGGITLFIAFGCGKNEDINDNSKCIKTIELKVGDCITLFDNLSVCFASVLNDSRCPKGATCCWEGNAVITIDVTKDGEKHVITLNTIAIFQTDTTLDNINIALLELNPYPDLESVSQLTDYKAKLSIADLDKISSNAKILCFSADKCMCCWGWTIKTGNDTIMSLDTIIARKIGYEINTPINVYIELGKIEKICSGKVKRKYYKINQIITPAVRKQ